MIPPFLSRFPTPRSYAVNVTAALDVVSVSQFANIEIQPESHHVPVQFVQVIAFPAEEKMAVDVELAVYGGPTIDCKVSGGRGGGEGIYHIGWVGVEYFLRRTHHRLQGVRG